MEERMRAGEQVCYGYVSYGSLVPCVFGDAKEQAPVFPARGWAVHALVDAQIGACCFEPVRSGRVRKGDVSPTAGSPSQPSGLTNATPTETFRTGYK